jgi:uncharacterized protein YukE
MMAPRAIADPEALERFARELKASAEGLNEISSRLTVEFMRLGETWQDQEHRKFAREFEVTMSRVKEFIKASEQYIPLLIRKARHLRDYLGQG